MSKWGRKLLALLRNPVIRPIEVWAVRLLLAYVSAKLGFDIAKGVSK